VVCHQTAGQGSAALLLLTANVQRELSMLEQLCRKPILGCCLLLPGCITVLEYATGMCVTAHVLVLVLLCLQGVGHVSAA
jgi:hypothetical protein